jgi:hypothetical protein
VEDALNAEAQHLAETQQAIDLPSQSRTDDTNTKTNTQPGLSNLLEASEVRWWLNIRDQKKWQFRVMN